MVVAAPYIMMAMAAVSAIGQISAGQQQARANDYNAELARQRGEMTMQAATSQAEIQARNNKRALAEAVADYGAAGVELGGSPLDVLSDQAQERKVAEEMILYRGRQGELISAGEADSYSMAARSARTASVFGAGSTLLSAAYMTSQMPAASSTAPQVGGATWGPYGKAGLRPY